MKKLHRYGVLIETKEPNEEGFYVNYGIFLNDYDEANVRECVLQFISDKWRIVEIKDCGEI